MMDLPICVVSIQAIQGIGRGLGDIFLAETGDIGRFTSPDSLCSWAGLTPKHR